MSSAISQEMMLDADGAIREWVGCTWDIEDIQAVRRGVAG